jgi:hypothetical protein
MSVDRGFVQKIEVNRGGQVTATVILVDGTTGLFTIQDLDGDPERFNERLSKLGLLRDAMNRAEPVEIEHDTVNQTQEIERLVRIGRDEIDPPTALTQVVGIVLSVQVTAQSLISAGGVDQPDTATVLLLTSTFATQSYTLNLQTPERLVAQAQLNILLAAQTSAGSVQLMVQTDNTISAVAVGGADAGTSAGGAQATVVSGFVETLGLIQPASGGGAASASFANAAFTTAPDFTGPGNTVSTAPFTPQLLTFLVPKQSPVYDLFETALRDNLRLRVRYVTATPPNNYSNEPGTAPAAANPTGAQPKVAATSSSSYSYTPPLIALWAELLAPLASASRPVWIVISRESLDSGPDGCPCVDGVPSSDLSVKTLRDLHIPYTAVWKGLGCFNHGVYRFQINAGCGYKLIVHGEKLCHYKSDDPKTCFFYACLHGDVEVIVELEGWTCDKDFQIDVYRIR